MRRLGVDLLIQPEEDVSEDKETDQMQRAVVIPSVYRCVGAGSMLPDGLGFYVLQEATLIFTFLLCLIRF